MRPLLAAFLILLGLSAGSSAQTCTGLACQQMSCPGGPAVTTTVSGIVYAPNGIDPLPNVIVYIPNAPVAAFTPGVSCPVVGQAPSGTPIAGATTSVDGSFTITNAPVGTNIPLVIISGRWRRQLVIPSTTSCVNTVLPSAPYSAANPVMPFASFPQNQNQGDIPKFAIATGGVDSVECVLRKVGISDSEFTDASAGGRINFFKGDYGGGSVVDTATPAEATLMANATTLNGYDVLMLPCEGGAYTRASTELSNLVSFANAGGRVYSSHYAYSWMYLNPPFDKVVNWLGSSGTTYANGTIATVNSSFSGGATLSQWLIDVGASSVNTPPAEIPLNQIKHDFNGVNSPTESWLTLDVTGNPVMQFVFDTPVASTTGQCGRVLYNEYHVETPVAATGSSSNTTFPNECASATSAMTAQEKLLEYSLFELTNDGGAATLTPTVANFGSVPLGFNSAAQSFTWTNNSTFTAAVTLLTGSQDFTVGPNNCTSVPAYGSCTITVVYSPSVLGAETGTLTVGSSGTTLTSALSGTGIPALTLSATSLSFGNLDVGGSLTQSLTAMNAASGPVTMPGLVATGPYTVASTCATGSSIPAGGVCPVTVTFHPTTTGPAPGTVALQTSYLVTATTLTGNGVDFTFTDNPTSGTVVAGIGTTTVLTTTPLAGFNANLTLKCTTTAPASLCTLGSTSFAPSAAVMTTATITTTSQYTVVGFGIASNLWLALAGLATGLLLWTRRRGLPALTRAGLTMLLLLATLGAASLTLTGCSGKQPAQNAVYTLPTSGAGAPSGAGPYVYTITATDGFLVHSATYSLDVTAK